MTKFYERYEGPSGLRTEFRLVSEPQEFREIADPFVVHTKFGGRFKKAVPVRVVGVGCESRRGVMRDDQRLLCRLDVEGVDYEKFRAYSTNYRSDWDYCYQDGTTEGYRFTRSVTALMRVLLQVARKVQIAQNKKERGDREAKARAGRDGECQICEGRQILQPTGKNKGTLVLHGYERPGLGYTVGQCYGYHRLPFEVSCDALKEWVAILDSMVAATRETLAGARVASTVPRQVRRQGKVVFEKLKADHPDFERTKQGWIRNLECELQAREGEERRQRARLAGWSPRG